VSATGNLDSSVPVDAAAEAVKEARLEFVVFADLLPALPRELVLSRVRDTLLQLCCDGGGGAEAVCDTAAIACALCSCRLVFGAQAADSYSTFLSSCVTAAASKGCLLPLLQTMLQLLPNERLLHLQVHQRIMAASIGGKYRPASPSLPTTLRRSYYLLLRRDYSKEFSILATSRISHLQQERSADPLLFITHYVQQVAATGKLPLELVGNIHLFRQRWWKSTFIPALLMPPPHGGSLPLAHIKLGELLVDRGMLQAQQV
jgi:hypothetical protein